MSKNNNNKNRLSKHKPKLPNKFNDHVMGNLSQKRNDSNEFDELEAFRVNPDDDIRKIGESGDKSKEKGKEGIDCGDEVVCMNSEDSGGSVWNMDNSKEQTIGDVAAEVESPKRGSMESNDVNVGKSSPIPVSSKTANDTTESSKKSYVNKLASGINDKDNELFFIPTSMKENGEKVVVFDEELIKEGSEKWKFTVCGYFVGYKMGVNELRYNVRRMWGKHGLKDSVVDADGISALASRLGRPIKMDQVTAEMCRAGTGRLGYARVLIEINAEEEYHDKIEINYCEVVLKPKTVVNNKRTSENHIGIDQEGFVEVRNRKNNNNKKGWNNFNQGNKKQNPGVNMEFWPKEPPMKPAENKQNEKEDSDEDEVYENNDQACEYVFGRWRWISNVIHSPTSCRIVVGWNADEVDIMVVQSCNQSILCLVEVIHTKVKLFVSFIYASNSGLERRQLWNDLLMHKSIVNNKAWVLIGDFNITLKPEEHSNEASSMSIDMNEFKDAVNKIEVDDLCSSRFQFT
ncbi:RNA-directed DNA polymerase, eukaryota, reverse transcriptase zinc-binding domain protein [Tanacetum coccineum]